MKLCEFIHPSIIFLAPTINRHCFRQQWSYGQELQDHCFHETYILEEEEDNKYVHIKWR